MPITVRASPRTRTDVTLEGYLALGTMTTCGGTCSVELRSQPEGGKWVNLYVTIGTGKNQVKELTREALTNKQLELTTNEGTVVGVGTKVRVTGGRLGTARGDSCAITDVDLIEKR